MDFAIPFYVPHFYSTTPSTFPKISLATYCSASLQTGSGIAQMEG